MQCASHKAKIGASLQRLTNKTVFGAFATWREWASRKAELKTKLQGAVGRLWHGQLAASWQAWRDYAQYSLDVKDRMKVRAQSARLLADSASIGHSAHQHFTSGDAPEFAASIAKMHVAGGNDGNTQCKLCMAVISAKCTNGGVQTTKCKSGCFVIKCMLVIESERHTIAQSFQWLPMAAFSFKSCV